MKIAPVLIWIVLQMPAVLNVGWCAEGGNDPGIMTSWQSVGIMPVSQLEELAQLLSDAPVQVRIDEGTLMLKSATTGRWSDTS